MKFILLTVLSFLLAISTLSAQVKIEAGTQFTFDNKSEKDLQFVLNDNYNRFLVSAINIDGMMQSNKIIIRKFDQKNQLLNTFTEDFPVKDRSVLHNYRGSFQAGTDKAVIFTEAYSGKEKKSEIYKTIFDKSSEKFTSSLIASFPFESLMKSGNLSVHQSENKKYFGICYQNHSSKKEPETVDCMLLDGNTLNVLWKKKAVFSDEFVTNEMTITNSGKLVFVRSARGFKLQNYITVIDEKSQQDKEISEEVKLQKPLSVSIGTQDYLVAFNYAAKGLRSGDFEKIMLYDLQSGKILKNNKITDFNTIKDLKSINFRNVFLQNEEIHLFTECKFQSGTKPNPVMPSSSFGDPVYKYGSPALITFSFDGSLKKIIKLNAANADPDLFLSFGLQFIKGNYFINTGFHSGIYGMTGENFESRVTKVPLDYGYDAFRNISGVFVNQLFYYFPDSKIVLLARVHPEINKMSLVNVYDFIP